MLLPATDKEDCDKLIVTFREFFVAVVGIAVPSKER
jgi:hypothetical protein